MEMWITVTSGLVSIIGAITSVYQAWNSKKSANAADLTLQRIRKHNKISDISQLKSKFQDTIRAMEKYGSSSQESLAGAYIEKDASAVQSFITALSEQKNHFDQYQSDTDSLLSNLQKLLSEFTTNKNEKSHGGKILNSLNSFSSIIKHIDDERFNVIKMEQ